MRLLVASDSHRAAGNLLDIVELHLEDNDVLLFLGDGENALENVRMLYPRLHILQVAGNCDWGSDLPAWGTAKLGGKTVFYTHGHPFHVKFGLAELEQAAREAHADICLFGHTHQQMTDYRDGLYLMNPGAVAEGCYGMVDITPGGIMLLPCRL